MCIDSTLATISLYISNGIISLMNFFENRILMGSLFFCPFVLENKAITS